jgi:hypothetical protein
LQLDPLAQRPKCPRQGAPLSPPLLLPLCLALGLAHSKEAAEPTRQKLGRLGTDVLTRKVLIELIN